MLSALRARPKAKNPSRKRVEKAQRDAAGIPAYLAEFSLRRGRCFKCRAARLGVVRLTIDYTSRKEVMTFAHVECGTCGHVWYRCQPPKLREYQHTRLTLLLPGDQRRWFARGRWHVQGEDVIVIGEATWCDLMDARAAWQKVNGQYEAARARAKARNEAKGAEALAKSRALMDLLHERDAEREREEREAALREAA